jgi:hypothetical protein
MEGLIELVAASLARQGIECPAEISQPMWKRAASPVEPAEPTLTIVLSEYSYRKLSEGDPAP